MHGILVQLPLPSGIDPERIIDRISPDKDVDGLHASSRGRLVAGAPGLRPCTPLGVNTHRILVTGERIIPTPADDLADAGKRPEIPTFPWWAVISAGVLIVVSGYVWLSGRPVRTRTRRGGAMRHADTAHDDTPGFATRPGDA